MVINITPQNIVLAGSVLGALTAIVMFFVGLVRWVDHQKEQDEKLKNLEETHNQDMQTIQREQTLMMYGILAALKGLSEQGCNGPVTEARNLLEKHLNKAAHHLDELIDS